MSWRILASALTLAVAASVGSPGFAQQRTPGARPDASGDEGGLWAQADKAEQQARASGELDADPALNAYVHDVACKVAAEYCADVRVYVMDRPYLNASMAPNGYMEVWSGLLLRAKDESELAFVLGHEVSHFSRNHGLESWRRLKAKANSTSLWVARAVVPGLAPAIYLGMLADVLQFTREDESEADRLGLKRSVSAGYAPAAGGAIWRARLEETAASDIPAERVAETRSSVYATHPITPERAAALEVQAKTLAAPGNVPDRHRAAIRPHLAAWLRDDLHRGDAGETLHLIDRLASTGEDLGVLNFYEGEAFRSRRRDDDLVKAEEAYAAAVKYADVPAAAWRELAELRRKRNDVAGAVEAYEAYLARCPDADDAWLVKDAVAVLKRAG